MSCHKNIANSKINTYRQASCATLTVRDYCGNYIYKDSKLERAMTDNGYMQDGELFFYIKDYQGNVRVVLDRESGLDWYDSHARWYAPQTGRTTTIDPMAEKYPHLSPYLWCAANPIAYIDPNGEDILLSGKSADIALQQIQKKVGSEIQLSLTNNSLSYQITAEGKPSKYAKLIMSIIDDGNITVDIIATDNDMTTTGNLFVGGAFMGNRVELDDEGNVVKTTAFQEINPATLGKMDAFSDEGTSILHEITEAYEGAKISSVKKTSSPNAKSPNSVYKKAHNKATYQPKVYERMLDSEGNETQNIKKAVKVEWYIRQNIEPYEERKIQTFP